jgi:hypothetical protein
MKADARGRIRFTKAGFRFEILPTDPTVVTVYNRAGDTETKLGTVDLIEAAVDLNFKSGDGVVVKGVETAEPIGVGGYF